MTPTNVDRLEEEWKKRGYHLVPDSISDLDLDYEAEREAEKNNQWTITILKDEADLFLKHALSLTEQAGIARGRELAVEAIKKSLRTDFTVQNATSFREATEIIRDSVMKALESALTTEGK